MLPVIHRATANSKRGRQMVSVGMLIDARRISAEIAEWNSLVDLKRDLKKNKVGNYLTVPTPTK